MTTDQELLNHVRLSLEDLHMTVPPNDIVRRGRAVRVRRVGSTAAAVMCASVIAVVVSMSVTTPSPALAAWTVSQTQSGPISVTIRQLADVQGLEAQLQSVGVASLVTASLAIPPPCTEWHAGTYSMGGVVTLTNESGLPASSGVEFTIQPSEIPQGALLWLGLAQTGAPAGSPGPAGPMSVGFFIDTPACSAAVTP
jgi:hypothetical protein